ncbi:hypothetical protein MAR_032277, partial [Mya arenaria]
LPNANTQTFIDMIKGILSRFALPNQVSCDNYTCYASHEFKKFANNLKSDHRNVSVVFKRILSKSLADGQDPIIGIPYHRATPLECEY